MFTIGEKVIIKHNNGIGVISETNDVITSKELNSIITSKLILALNNDSLYSLNCSKLII